MQEIILSVAVITYNQENFIAQTLDSVLNQEHDYEYEIVIGEDCSTDNTKKIIEEYAKQYPNIIKPLYNNQNKGLINNYFNVINHCRGKYIMECAGDDYWLSGKVKSQIEFMEENSDIGMCYTKVKFWNEDKQKFAIKMFGSDIESFENLLTTENKVPALSVCFRKNLVEQYIDEIRPSEKNWLMEDYPMWLWFSHEAKVKFIDEVTAVYRVLENSASHSVDVDKQIKFTDSIFCIKEFFSTRYNVFFDESIRNLSLFNLCFSIYRKSFDIKIIEYIDAFYFKIQNKTFISKLKYFLVNKTILLKLLNVLIKIKEVL